MTSGAWPIAPPATWASAWWPRQTPSTGTVGAPQRLQRHADVARVLGAARARRDDDVVHRQRRELLPRQLVVAHDDRLVAVDLAQQVEEVEGEGVVVVDQQRAHRPHLHSADLGSGAPRAHHRDRGDDDQPRRQRQLRRDGRRVGRGADRHQALPGHADAAQPARDRRGGREPHRRHPALQPGGARRSAPADPPGGGRRRRGARRRLLVARGPRRGDRRRRAARARQHGGRRRRQRARVPRLQPRAPRGARGVDPRLPRAPARRRRRSAPSWTGCRCSSTRPPGRASARRWTTCARACRRPRDGPRRGARAPAPGHARGRGRRRAPLRRARRRGQPPRGRARGRAGGRAVRRRRRRRARARVRAPLPGRAGAGGRCAPARGRGDPAARRARLRHEAGARRRPGAGGARRARARCAGARPGGGARRALRGGHVDVRARRPRGRGRRAAGHERPGAAAGALRDARGVALRARRARGRARVVGRRRGGGLRATRAGARAFGRDRAARADVAAAGARRTRRRGVRGRAHPRAAAGRRLVRGGAGRRFHPRAARSSRRCWSAGAAGAGQSSWGPAVYGIVGSEAAARELAGRMAESTAGQRRGRGVRQRRRARGGA